MTTRLPNFTDVLSKLQPTRQRLICASIPTRAIDRRVVQQLAHTSANTTIQATAGNVAVILHAPAETNCHDVIVHRKDVPLLTSTSKQVTVYDNGYVNGQKVCWLTPVPNEGTYAINNMGDGTINTTVVLRNNAKFKNPASGLRRVPYTNSHYDALAFPLFFHRGTQTWGNGFEAHTHIWPISNSSPTLL